MSPRLSVVVPIYNVELYLADCLQSLAEQTLTDLDIVLVDDGSTDGSHAICAGFADRDPRFRVVQRPNGGLSAARNTGVEHIMPGTEYLVFLDSDDVVPPQAYEKMVAMLDETGSDFVTGNVWRLHSAGRYQAGQYKHLRKTVKRTHVTRDFKLLGDRVAWNKVFRRDFWEKYAFLFPDGRVFEDTPVTIPAHFLARSVDVMHEHIYYWRAREGSITRSGADPKGLSDRLAGVLDVSRFLATGEGGRFAGFKPEYDISVLTDDLPSYIDSLTVGSEEYRGIFMKGAGEILSMMSESTFARVPVEERARWELVREGRLDDLLALLEFQRRNSRHTFGVSALGKSPKRGRNPLDRLPVRRAVFPGRTAPLELPDRTTVLQRTDLPVNSRLTEARWVDGRLRLRGYAYIRNVGTGEQAGGPKGAVLVPVGTTHRIGRGRFSVPAVLPVPVRGIPAALATDQSGQEVHNYDRSGFEITIDPQRLKRNGTWIPGSWKIGVGLLHGTMARRTGIHPGPAGTAANPPALEIGEGVRLVPEFVRGSLRLSVKESRAGVTGHRAADGDTVEISGRSGGELPPQAVRLTHRQSGTRVDVPVTAEGRAGGYDFTARLSVSDLTSQIQPPEVVPHEVIVEAFDAWSPELLTPDGMSRPLSVDAALPRGAYPAGEAAGKRFFLSFERTATGLLQLTRRTPYPVVDGVSWQPDNGLTLTGTVPPVFTGDAVLVLKNSGYKQERVFPLTFDGDRFTVTVRPGAVSDAGAERPLVEGRWYVYLRDEATLGPAGYAITRVAASAVDMLPAAQRIHDRVFTLQRVYTDQLFLESGSALPAEARGRYRQRQLINRNYKGRRDTPLRPVVLFDNFEGRQFSDSPRAVYEELARRGAGLEYLWAVDDQQVAGLPDGVTAVARGGARWFEALATSRYVVANNHLPDWFVRRDGQTVLQTWHGTPLKRIGLDLADTLYSDSTVGPRLRRLTSQWSCLVSPNAFSTETFRRSLAFEGEILTTGSPRVDLLLGADRDATAARVRTRLGIPADRRIVLYAPTWRDDQAYNQTQFKLDLQLDIDAMRTEIGDDHVLLVHAHPQVVDRLSPVDFPADGFVRDVTSYPDVAELLVAADVLITDYSAVMCDFAATRRPILVFAPDLPHYRKLRGLNIDLATQAPGPVLTDTAGVVRALRDIDAVTAEHQEDYAEFQRTFGPLDDGAAAARATDRLLQ